ncbi:hypothetical protein NDU88_003105 [Pleurodeles waltl]|uniref:Uncharacterized protein n=1 Tax=Pleurodeles waltl TaxID=8319 RepID=A0AAV7W4C2_PLEWA|nr:hypothetical protein NDU88_003105 [Pleurodeles waltl]
MKRRTGEGGPSRELLLGSEELEESHATGMACSWSPSGAVKYSQAATADSNDRHPDQYSCGHWGTWGPVMSELPVPREQARLETQAHQEKPCQKVRSSGW